MMSNSELTMACHPLNLYVKGELTEYSASPLSDKDYDELDNWIQSLVVSIARNALRQQLEDAEVSQAQYDEEIGIAYTSALGVSIYEARGTSAINTPKGVARLLWLMLRAKHPKIKYQDLIPLCRQIENRIEILAVYNKLNPGTTDKSGGVDEGDAKND